jgi:molybdenum cofactor biosynthesis protein B
MIVRSRESAVKKMSSSSASEHKEKATKKGPVIAAIVTVSDTRTPATDINGKYLKDQLEAAGHTVHSSRIIEDEPALVESVLKGLAAEDLHVILFNGGTGISRRDTTFDALDRNLEKTLPGFGEIFRALSYAEIGSAAIMSRATAGVYGGKVIISTPGSPAAVRLAWEKLISGELAHLAWEVSR